MFASQQLETPALGIGCRVQRMIRMQCPLQITNHKH